MESFDLIIVGGGPAGLAAAIYAIERKLKTIVLEANSAGGQPQCLYPEKYIYDYPGFIKIKGSELAQKMIDQVLKSGCMIAEDCPVINIVKDKKQFQIEESKKNYISKSVILATGIGDYSSKHLLVSGEENFTNKGIFYQKLPASIIRKRIVIVGGGDTALENAVQATENGAYVTLIHRNKQFRASEKTVAKAKSLGVKMYLNNVVNKINGNNYLENIEIKNELNETRTISTDYLVVCIGMELNKNFISKLGIEIKNQAVLVNTDLQTSIPGMFACGDIIVPTGNYKRITNATGSGATAINGIYKYLKNPYWGK